MTDQPMTGNESIDSLQAYIADLMAREVLLSREILSSMREEETALLTHDDSALQETMSKRNAPLQELMSIREDRIISVKELAFLLFKSRSNELAKKNQQTEPFSFKDLLDLSNVESCEVLVLRDQLIALIEKMNSQNSSNRQLFDHHREYAKALNAHLDMWGYSAAEKNKPLIERRKMAGVTVMD